ncbi:MAG: nitrous oxide reductase accessory protein NosL [Desulfosarcina sp.]|nr:nitrous oxide reductase accessory protein NosL [Desulfobacterales bacterium]
MPKQPHNQHIRYLTPAASRLVIGLLVGAAILAGAANARSDGPRPGKLPLDPRNRMQISPADRCPVCAMRPIKYPRFAAAIRLKDGTSFYFCSAGCMLKAWLRPDVFLGGRPEILQLPVALDYFTGRPLDAREAFWISGSDVIGPMGPALVPLQQSDHIAAFRRRHGSARVFRLEELNQDNWEALTGKPFGF